MKNSYSREHRRKMKLLIFTLVGFRSENISDPSDENIFRPNDRGETDGLEDYFQDGQKSFIELNGGRPRMFSGNRFSWLSDFVEDEEKCENGYWTKWFNRYR